MLFLSYCLSEKCLFHLHFSLGVDYVGPMVIIWILASRLSEIEAIVGF